MNIQERVSLRPALLKELLLRETGSRKRRKMEKLAAKVRIEWAADNPDAESGAIADHLEAAGDTQGAAQWWQRSLPFEVLAGNPRNAVRAGLKLLEFLDQKTEEYADIAITVGVTLLLLELLFKKDQAFLSQKESSEADDSSKQEVAN